MEEIVTVIGNLDTWQEIVEIEKLWDKEKGWNMRTMKIPVI